MDGCGRDDRASASAAGRASDVGGAAGGAARAGLDDRAAHTPRGCARPIETARRAKWTVGKRDSVKKS